jgi:hypothetical protein
MVAAGTMEKKMRVLSQSEQLSLSRVELMGLLHRIASELATLPEGSYELRIAHYTLQYPPHAGAVGLPATLSALVGMPRGRAPPATIVKASSEVCVSD